MQESTTRAPGALAAGEEPTDRPRFRFLWPGLVFVRQLALLKLLCLLFSLLILLVRFAGLAVFLWALWLGTLAVFGFKVKLLFTIFTRSLYNLNTQHKNACYISNIQYFKAYFFCIFLCEKLFYTKLSQLKVTKFNT